MSRETIEWLNTNTLIGFTDKRGRAWHYRASDQDAAEPNHYPGPIPIEAVQRRLLFWEPVEGTADTTYITADGVSTINDPTSKAIVRPDTKTVLAYVKRDYKIHEYNEWLLTNISRLLDDGDLAIGSAGLLRGGAVAWVQVEMPATCTTDEGVEFRPFLSGATSLDMSMSTTYVAGAQVVVCDNTLSAALADTDAKKIKIRHTSRSLGRIGQAREALAIVHRVADDFATQVKALCNVTVTDRQWKAFLNAYAPMPAQQGRSRSLAQARHDKLNQMWDNDARVTPWRDTAFGVVQAVNTYTHHLKTVRGVPRSERNAERTVTGKADALDLHTVTVLDQVLGGALTR